MTNTTTNPSEPATQMAENSAARMVPENLSDLLAQHGTNPDADSGQRINHRPSHVEFGHLIHVVLGLAVACVLALTAAHPNQVTWAAALIYGTLAGVAVHLLRKQPVGTSGLGFGVAMAAISLGAVVLATSPLLMFWSINSLATLIPAGIASIAIVVTAGALVTGKMTRLARIAAPIAAMTATLIAG
jgi:hypothetical protein